MLMLIEMPISFVIKAFNHEDDSKKWFGNKIVIEDGVNYFLKDCGHNDNCIFNDKMYDRQDYTSIEHTINGIKAKVISSVMSQ
jgi:hypothetical protein